MDLIGLCSICYTSNTPLKLVDGNTICDICNKPQITRNMTPQEIIYGVRSGKIKSQSFDTFDEWVEALRPK